MIAGSFVINDDVKPRVIDLDFPALPTGDGRASKLFENGALINPPPCSQSSTDNFQMLFWLPSLTFSPQTNTQSSILQRLATLLPMQNTPALSRTRWTASFKRPCTWISNETYLVTSEQMTVMPIFQMDRYLSDINFLAQVSALILKPNPNFDISYCS